MLGDKSVIGLFEFLSVRFIIFLDGMITTHFKGFSVYVHYSPHIFTLTLCKAFIGWTTTQREYRYTAYIPIHSTVKWPGCQIQTLRSIMASLAMSLPLLPSGPALYITVYNHLLHYYFLNKRPSISLVF